MCPIEESYKTLRNNGRYKKWRVIPWKGKLDIIKMFFQKHEVFPNLISILGVTAVGQGQRSGSEGETDPHYV